MWIVIVRGTWHSAWKTKTAAQKQKNVLLGYGYKHINLRFVEGLTVTDGHYYWKD